MNERGTKLHFIVAEIPTFLIKNSEVDIGLATVWKGYILFAYQRWYYFIYSMCRTIKMMPDSKFLHLAFR